MAFRRLLLALGIVAILLPRAPALAQDAGALRAAGVAAAREGRLQEGVRLLDSALAAAPGDRATLADLVVVLSWAGRDREALARFSALGEAAAPAYALAAAAVSARRSGDAARAVQLYRAAMAGGDVGTETRIGLALAEAARGDRATARDVLAQAEAADPGNARIAQALREIERPAPAPRADVAARVRALAASEGGEPAAAFARASAQGADPASAAALADVLMEIRRPFDALAVLEPALARAPRDPALRRREALALAATGAPELALARAAGVSGALSAAEERRLGGAAAAFAVRWGGQVAVANPRDPALRHARTDAAIAALDAAIAAWRPLGPDAAGAVRTARLDRLVALRDRGRMADVVAEAAALRMDGELPAYAREALGDALLDQRRPEDAEAEYRAVLAEAPNDISPALGLFYALSEQRRWAEARAVAQRLEREVPTFRALRGPEPPTEEWDRLQAVGSGILWRAWTDDLTGAEALAAPLAAEAPMNASLRSMRGDIWRSRGWPEAALEEYETAQTDAPDALDLRLGRAAALLDRRRFAAARADIAALGAEYPENATVRRLVRQQEIRDMRELEVSLRGGLERGSDEPELDIGIRLYTPPIAENWRAFGGARLRTGEAHGSRLTTYRALAGLEWRGPEAVVTGGVTLDVKGLDRGGAFVDAAIRLSDIWSLDLGGEISAADTPLQALREGIHADAARAGFTWRHSDLREAAAYARVMRFSDDNTRLIGFARFQERVMNLPDWKLDLQPYVYASSNSRQNVPYFSPEQDTEVAATAALTWIAWKRYEPELRVRLVLTGGGYWQHGFGWSSVLSARWENQHILTDTLALAYGAGWMRRDYDGRAQDSAALTGALRWRF